MDLPCIDCICFAICKDTVPMRHSGTALMGHIQNNLVNKCSLIHDFIYDNDSDKGSGVNIFIVTKYYKNKMNQ